MCGLRLNPDWGQAGGWMKNSLNEEALSPRPRQVGASGQVSIGGDLGTS